MGNSKKYSGKIDLLNTLLSREKYGNFVIFVK